MGRVAVFFDGFNFYYGLRALRRRTHVCWYWLNLEILAACIMEALPGYTVNDVLEHVLYFTANIKFADAGKHWRQKNYLEMLEGTGQAKVVRGDYQLKQIRCPNCDNEPVTCKQCNFKLQVPREKKTDVNIAMYATLGAMQDRYDSLVIVSSDSDLAPVAELIRKHFKNPVKRVYYAFPPEQLRNQVLISEANGFCEITEQMLEWSIMRRVVQVDTRRFSCPSEWTEGGAVR
ncbi:NYN domain-containing protein [bacterium]|nr:NYN domain-containing protein [bacterium]